MPQVRQYPGMPRLPYWKFVSPSPPISEGAPHVTGSVHVGGTLTCTTGVWTNAPTSFAYQWLRNGVIIAGATTNTHVNVAGDNGTFVSCQVTATNAIGSQSAISNEIAVIT